MLGFYDPYYFSFNFYGLALVFDTVLEAPWWAGMAPLALAVTLWLDPHFREERRGRTWARQSFMW